MENMKNIIWVAFFMICGLTFQSEALSSDVAKSRVRRVKYGESTIIRKFPWQVQLIRRGRLVCGGSIMGYQWVITAAHCVDTGTAQDYAVVVSSTRLYKENKFKVKQLVVHEDYVRATFVNDIALIKIDGEFTLDKYTQVVRLADSGTELDNETPVRVSGHGESEYERVTKDLREGLLHTVANEQCAKLLNGSKVFNGNKFTEFNLQDSQLCIRYPEREKGFCYGDSGGPVVSNEDVQVGVVSVTFGCGDPEQPSVCAKISYYKPWIGKNTGIY